MYKISGKLVTANCDLIQEEQCYYDFVKITEVEAVAVEVDAKVDAEISIYSLWKFISEGGKLELPHNIF
jgi:hypothetical protein